MIDVSDNVGLSFSCRIKYEFRIPKFLIVSKIKCYIKASTLQPHTPRATYRGLVLAQMSELPVDEEECMSAVRDVSLLVSRLFEEWHLKPMKLVLEFLVEREPCELLPDY